MKQLTTHEEQLTFLSKIEGQVRGIERMIQQRRYCVEIITQIHSIIGALQRVENQIFKKHIDGCVVGALRGAPEAQKQKKIDEIIELLARFRKVT